MVVGKIFFERILIPIAIILYIASLFLPGIVFNSELKQNSKYQGCFQVIEEGFECQKFNPIDHSGIITCESPKEGVNYVSKSAILNHCGNDWKAPVSETKVYSGFTVLKIGWFAGVMGIFSWWANPLLLLSFFFYIKKVPKNGMMLSGIAFILALQSFFLTTVPQDEGGVKKLTVDYLGAGYYLWLASIALTFLYFIKTKKT